MLKLKILTSHRSYVSVSKSASYQPAPSRKLCYRWLDKFHPGRSTTCLSRRSIEHRHNRPDNSLRLGDSSHLSLVSSNSTTRSCSTEISRCRRTCHFCKWHPDRKRNTARRFGNYRYIVQLLRANRKHVRIIFSLNSKPVDRLPFSHSLLSLEATVSAMQCHVPFWHTELSMTVSFSVGSHRSPISARRNREICWEISIDSLVNVNHILLLDKVLIYYYYYLIIIL